MARQRILLAGAEGNLGQALLNTLHRLQSNNPDTEVLGLNRHEFDLARPKDAILQHLDNLAPSVIINPAAYTHVDNAEDEQDLANHINGDAPGWLGEWAVSNNAYLLHFSTDYVFDGSKETAYTPEDIPNPLNTYGHSKLAGERNILDCADEHALILRVSWLFGARPMGFVHFLQQAFEQQQPVKAVIDQVGTPTWTESVAELLPRLLAERPTGLCHACNHGEVSRYDQAMFFYRALGLSQTECEERIEQASSRDFFQRAKRPRYTAMVSSFDAMPTWEEATQKFLANQVLVTQAR
jgi:dTDP-4-dehydrorhamnose reductase